MNSRSFTAPFTSPSISSSTAPPSLRHSIHPHQSSPKPLHHLNTKSTTTTRAINIDNVSYQDGAYKVEGILLTPASPDLVYAVLSDYSSLPTVFSNISSCSLMPHYNNNKEDATSLVVVDTNDNETDSKYISQTCTWEIFNGMFKGDFVTELAVVENSIERKLSFSLVESAFMKEFIGGWCITPYHNNSSSSDNGNGSESHATTTSTNHNNNNHHHQQLSSHVRHSLKVTPTVSPPQKIGDVTKQIFVAQVRGILTDLEQELNRRHTMTLISDHDDTSVGVVGKEEEQEAVSV